MSKFGWTLAVVLLMLGLGITVLCLYQLRLHTSSVVSNAAPVVSRRPTDLKNSGRQPFHKLSGVKTVSPIQSSIVAKIPATHSSSLLSFSQQLAAPLPAHCDASTPADTKGNPSADKSIESGWRPYIGEQILIEIFPPQTRKVLRITAFNGNAQIPIIFRLPNDLGPFHDAYQFATYPGLSFRYRFELCDPDSSPSTWVPITTPSHITYASIGEGDDTQTMIQDVPGVKNTRGGDDAETMVITYRLFWMRPGITTRVQVEHHCHGIGFEVATNYARASTFITGHESDGPYPVKRLGVAMKYGGNLQIGTHDNPNYPDTGNPDAPGSADSLSPFPYGSPITQTVNDAAFVEVSDQNRAVLIDVCSGFEGIAASETYDGRTAVVGMHTQ